MGPFLEISSPENPRLKLFGAAAAGKRRDLVLVEGVRHCRDALAGGMTPKAALLTPEMAAGPAGRELLAALARCRPEPAVCRAPARLLRRVSAVETPQGVALLLDRPVWTEEELFTGGPLLFLCGVQDPGNAGTLARSALAAGCSGLLALAGGADPLGPKAVRAAAGTTLRLPSLRLESAAAALALLARRNIPLVGAEMAGGVDYRRAPFPEPAILVLGPEAGGLPAEVEDALALRVTIPMAPGVESLNVAVAGSLLLFELARRREDRA